MSLINNNKPKLSKGDRFLQILQSIDWDHPIYADILAGWMFLAYFKSKTAWRPHIWITGTGVNFLIDNLVNPILMSNSSSYTYPEIPTARKLKNVCKPNKALVLQNLESFTGEKEMRVLRGFINLAKKASQQKNNSEISLALFTSKEPQLEEEHDREYFTEISIGPWGCNKVDISCLLTYEYYSYFSLRSKLLLSKINKCIKVMADSLQLQNTNNKEIQQISTLLSGRYLLTNDKVPTKKQAQKFLESREISIVQTSEFCN